MRTLPILDWKNIVTRLFALLIVIGLTACAVQPVLEENAANGLTIAVPQGSAAKAMKAAAETYRQTTGETLKVAAIASDLYATQASAALLAGLDRYDLVYLDADSLARWVSYHALQPLDAATSADPWKPLATVAGQVYGLPVQPDALVLWYRADLFEQQHLAVPSDWAAFRQAAAALNAPPERYGAVIAGSDQESGAPFAAVLAGFGVQAVSGAYQAQIDGAGARQALALYAGLRNTDHVVSPDTDQYSSGEVIQALSAGKAAMGLASLSAAQQLTDCKANPKMCVDGKPLLAWAWLPGVEKTMAVGRMDVWAIPVHADPAAQRFVSWLASDEGARAWARGGGTPANSTVLADAWSVAHIPGAEALSGLRVFQAAFPPATTVDQLWKASNQAVHQTVTGETPPDQALETAAKQMRQALRQGGY